MVEMDINNLVAIFGAKGGVTRKQICYDFGK